MKLKPTNPKTMKRTKQASFVHHVTRSPAQTNPLSSGVLVHCHKRGGTSQSVGVLEAFLYAPFLEHLLYIVLWMKTFNITDQPSTGILLYTGILVPGIEQWKVSVSTSSIWTLTPGFNPPWLSARSTVCKVKDHTCMQSYWQTFPWHTSIVVL